MGAMTALMAAAAGASLVSAYQQSEAQKMQGEFAKDQADVNAQLADMEAKSAEERGVKLQQQHAVKAKQLMGAQRVGLAAQNLDLSSGGAFEIQKQAMEMSAEDQMAIRNNAWKEAWGLRTQASQYRTQGEMARAGGRNAAGNTLLTGFGQAASYGLQAYKGGGKRSAPSGGGGYGTAGESNMDYSNLG